MGLLAWPRLSFSPPFSLPRNRLRLLSLPAVKMSMRETSESHPDESAGAAVLWYKHDLRIDDHPGLIAASRFRTVIPLYIFDRRILSRFSDEMLELLIFAVDDLKKSLKEQGSELMIRFGNAENVICELVKEVNVANIFAEEEVEYDLCRLMDIVTETLSMVYVTERSPKLVAWSPSIYNLKSLKDLPSSYHDFQRLKLPVVPPQSSPKLPDLDLDLSWGVLPSMDELKKFLSDDLGKSKEKLKSIKNTSPKNALLKDQVVRPGMLIEGLELSRSVERKRPKNSAFLTRRRNSVGGGTRLVLNALAAYLRYLEGTARDDWQEVHEKLHIAERREGASFDALFRSSLNLGIISPRRVYHETIKYEKERNGGFISPFGYSAATVAAAANSVCSMEWYRLMALKSQMNDGRMYSIRIWRWNGYLIQYTAAGCQGPAVVLVHGFGAFLEHFRHNINGISENGNRVWAITLLGFGKSEKPNTTYTELMWADLIRDFVVDVVGEPVHLIGNSIGGYVVAIAAGLWPALAKSIVLINAAGNVTPGYSSVPYSQINQERRPSGAAWLGARLLQLYLRLTNKTTVKNYYPTKPDRADDWLINEMLRASYDPGAIVVLESIFTFDLSIPLNYLLQDFEGKVLVIQGMKDPLSDSKAKLAMLKEHCKGIVTTELDAGHCPHDELPEEVNSIIQEWIVTIERQIIPVAAQ